MFDAAGAAGAGGPGPSRAGQPVRKRPRSEAGVVTKPSKYWHVSRQKKFWMRSPEDRVLLRDYGHRLLNPSASGPEDYPQHRPERFQSAVRVQYKETGAPQVMDLWISSYIQKPRYNNANSTTTGATTSTVVPATTTNCNNNSDNNATTTNADPTTTTSGSRVHDMRMFLKQEDLPEGVGWDGQYVFKFVQQENEALPLLTINDDPRPPQADAQELPSGSTTAGTRSPRSEDDMDSDAHEPEDGRELEYAPEMEGGHEPAGDHGIDAGLRMAADACGRRCVDAVPRHNMKDMNDMPDVNENPLPLPAAPLPAVGAAMQQAPPPVPLPAVGAAMQQVPPVPWQELPSEADKQLVVDGLLQALAAIDASPDMVQRFLDWAWDVSEWVEWCRRCYRRWQQAVAEPTYMQVVIDTFQHLDNNYSATATLRNGIMAAVRRLVEAGVLRERQELDVWDALDLQRVDLPKMWDLQACLHSAVGLVEQGQHPTADVFRLLVILR